jgi:DNA-binding response OmpR family regulator
MTLEANATLSILVVDDQSEILENLELVLVAEGYRVLLASDGIEALAVLQSQPVDLILADIAMPRMNGYQLYERVRQNPGWVAIPFLFLTARTLDSDIRYGKELGVDDYLTKPIQPEDLLAAIQGKLRRAQQLAQLGAVRPPGAPQAGARALIVGVLRIDSGQHEVWMGEEPIKLSAREFTLLECLARRASEVVSPQELIRATHGLETDHIEAGSLLRPLIRSLRRKLGYPAGETGCITNVRSVGYRLIPPNDS